MDLLINITFLKPLLNFLAGSEGYRFTVRTYILVQKPN